MKSNKSNRCWFNGFKLNPHSGYPYPAKGDLLPTQKRPTMTIPQLFRKRDLFPHKRALWDKSKNTPLDEYFSTHGRNLGSVAEDISINFWRNARNPLHVQGQPIEGSNDEAKLVPEQMFREGFIKGEGVLAVLPRAHHDPAPFRLKRKRKRRRKRRRREIFNAQRMNVGWRGGEEEEIMFPTLQQCVHLESWSMRT